MAARKYERLNYQELYVIENRLQEPTFKEPLKSDGDFVSYGNGVYMKVRYIFVRASNYERIKSEYEKSKTSDL